MGQPVVPIGKGPPSELAELRRVARGEAEALRTLYDRYSPTVFAIAMRVLGSRGEAEEVVQETFLEVWRRAREYDPRRGAAVAWLITIGRTRAIDRLRSRASQDRALVQADPPQAQVFSPIDVSEGHQLRDRVQVALAGLPPEQRRVLEMAYFEGLSQSEIAEKTGEALGTVKTRVRLGMEKLSTVLAETWKVERQ